MGKTKRVASPPLVPARSTRRRNFNAEQDEWARLLLSSEAPAKTPGPNSEVAGPVNCSEQRDASVPPEAVQSPSASAQVAIPRVAEVVLLANVQQEVEAEVIAAGHDSAPEPEAMMPDFPLDDLWSSSHESDLPEASAVAGIVRTVVPTFVTAIVPTAVPAGMVPVVTGIVGNGAALGLSPKDLTQYVEGANELPEEWINTWMHINLVEAPGRALYNDSLRYFLRKSIEHENMQQPKGMDVSLGKFLSAWGIARAYGRGTGRNRPIKKGIRLTPEGAANFEALTGKSVVGITAT